MMTQTRVFPTMFAMTSMQCTVVTASSADSDILAMWWNYTKLQKIKCKYDNIKYGTTYKKIRTGHLWPFLALTCLLLSVLLIIHISLSKSFLYSLYILVLIDT